MALRSGALGRTALLLGVLVLAAAAGLLAGRATTETRPALWAIVFTAVLAAPLVYAIRTRTFDLFEPIWVVVGFLWLKLPGQALYLAYVSHYQIGILPIGRWSYLIDVALITGIFGTFAFYVGYYRCEGLATRLAGVLPRFAGRPDPRRAGIAIAVLTVISLAAYGALMKSPAGIVDFIKNLHSHNQAFEGHYALYFGIQMSIVAGLLWLALWPLRRRWAAASLVYIAITFILILSLGGRALAGTVIELALVVYNYGVRPIRLRTFAFVAVALLVLAVFVGAYRNQTSSTAAGRGSLATRIEHAASPTGFANQFFQSDLSSLDMSVLMLDRVPSQIHPGDGSTFAAIATSFIPRRIWHGKPQQFDTIIAQKLVYSGSTGKPATLLAEGYWNFLWPGVLLVMFLLGVVAKAAYKYLKVGRRSVGVLVVYAILWKWVWHLTGGGVSEVTLKTVMLLVPAMLAIWFVHRREA